MRQSVSVVSLFLVLVSAGCAESHGAGDVDGGAIACTAGAGSAPFACVIGYGPVCSDVLYPAECVGDVWTCPSGTIRESDAGCRCHGGAPPGCVCGESGWDCDALDAGPPLLDAATGCPADPSSAEGIPCAPEGMSCGRCTDSCGWCNILVCNGGVWDRLEAFPPPEPCTSFDCGPELRCQAETQYCERVLSDVGGVPDDFACRPMPPGCTSCECTPVPEACEQGPEGGMTITWGGG